MKNLILSVTLLAATSAFAVRDYPNHEDVAISICDLLPSPCPFCPSPLENPLDRVIQFNGSERTIGSITQAELNVSFLTREAFLEEILSCTSR